MADEQTGTGSWGDYVPQVLSNAVSQAGDAAVQVAGKIKEITQPYTDRALDEIPAATGDEPGMQPFVTPPSAAPTGDATGQPVNPFTAQQPAAPFKQPAPTDMELARAALICGYTAQNAPRQMTDADLSDYHGVSTNIIGARPDAFYRRWVIKTTRDALPDSPPVCRAILADPYGAGQLVPHVSNLVGLNQALAQGSKQDDEGILGAAINLGGEFFDKAHDLFANPPQYARDHLSEDVYGGIGHAVQVVHDNTPEAVRNELNGIAHGVVRVGGFNASRPMALLDLATGSNVLEKWSIRQFNQAESWLPEESEEYRPVLNNAIYSAISGLGNGTAAGLKGASILASAAPVAYDWAASQVTGNEHHEAGDWWYANTSDRLDNQRASLALDPNGSFLDKVFYSAATGIGLLPFIIPTRGAGTTGFAAQIAPNALRVAPLSIINGINAGNDVFAQTGDSGAARKAMLTTTLVTEILSLIPTSLPGKPPIRTTTALATTPLTSEAARHAINAALPENMRQKFSWENLVASGILNAGMAGMWPHSAGAEAPNARENITPPTQDANPAPNPGKPADTNAHGAQNDAPAPKVDIPNQRTASAPEPQGAKPAPDTTHPPGAKEGESAPTPPPEPAHGPEAAALIEQSRASLTRAFQAYSAARHAQNLADIIESGKQVSPLGESSPEKLQDIVQDMGNETGNRALTISPDDFIKAMEQGGITPQEFQASMPDVYAQLQYLAPGESLQILHTDLARNPEVMEHVVPFARAGEGAPNAVEAMAQANEHFDGLVQKIKAVAERGAAGEAEPQGTDKDNSQPPDPVLSDNARTAEELNNKLLKLNDLAKNSPLRQSDPASFAQEVQKIMGPNPGKGFYVNGRVFLGMLRADCKARKDYSLLANLPSIAPDLARDLPHAIENNGDVLVPLDVFTAHFAGKMDSLLPFAKPAPGMPSHAEAQALLKGEPNPAENHGNTGAESWGNTHPPLPPEQVKVPGGGLRAMEHIGGHVLEKHVGKTLQQLEDRFATDPNKKLKDSSSFYDEATAEGAIAAALKADNAKIKAWLASGDKEPFRAKTIMNAPIGIKISRGSTLPVHVSGVKAVLIRDPLSPLGYYILTGHPQ